MNIESKNNSTMHAESDYTYIFLVFEEKKCCLHDVHCISFTDLHQIHRFSRCPNVIEYSRRFIFVHLQQPKKSHDPKYRDDCFFTYCKSIAIMTQTNVSQTYSLDNLLTSSLFHRISLTECNTKNILSDIFRRSLFVSRRCVWSEKEIYERTEFLPEISNT